MSNSDANTRAITEGVIFRVIVKIVTNQNGKRVRSTCHQQDQVRF